MKRQTLRSRISNWALLGSLSLFIGCSGNMASKTETSPQAIGSAPDAGRAVNNLVVQASDMQAQQQWERAAALLERALRIEPRNGGLWHQLARVRLQQARFGMAESLAQKSNALAGDDTELRAQNALLIELAQQGRVTPSP